MKRTKLHKGPFGARRQTARLQFELLAQGARGAALSRGVEGAISSACGAAFASHETPGADGASFASVAAFFGASCCRVGAEDDEEAFERLSEDGDEPADERVEVDVDDDDDDLPPWTAGDAEVTGGAPARSTGTSARSAPQDSDAARRRGEVRGRASGARGEARDRRRDRAATARRDRRGRRVAPGARAPRDAGAKEGLYPGSTGESEPRRGRPTPPPVHSPR